jgi:hypothetical protein
LGPSWCVKLFTEAETTFVRNPKEVLVHALIIIELVSELTEGSLKVVWHNSMELLFHLITVLVVIEASFNNVASFEVI